MKEFTATAERSGGWWAISVPEVPGVHTQVRRLDQAPAMAREAVALMLDVSEGEVDVKVLPVLGKEVDVLVGDLARARNDARRSEAVVSAATRQAIEILVGQQGLTVRDAGTVLGLSFQRVAQLTKESTPQTTTARRANRPAARKAAR